MAWFDKLLMVKGMWNPSHFRFRTCHQEVGRKTHREMKEGRESKFIHVHDYCVVVIKGCGVHSRAYHIVV